MSVLNIWRVDLPAGVWTPVTTPFSPRSMTLVNVSPQTLRMRSNPEDANTEDTLPVSSQQTIALTHDGTWDRVSPAQVLIYMQPSTNEIATVVIRCTP